MSQMLHIMRKDIHRLRWLLMLGLVVLITRVILVVNGAHAADETVAIGLLLQQTWGTIAVVELLLMGSMVARLVLDEPLVGLTPFWLTRPYATRSLIRAKVLLAAVLVVLLPLIADLVTMSLLGAGPQALVRAGATAAFTYASWMVSLMLLAALTPSFSGFVLAALGLATGLSVLRAAFVGFAGIWSRPAAYTLPVPRDIVTPVVVMMVMYLCAALSVIAYQYYQRRWRVATGLTIAGLVATFIVSQWPWSLVRAEQVSADPETSGLVVAHDPSWGTKVADVINVSRQMSERWRYVNARFTLSGLPSTMLVQTSVGIRSKLQFPDGSVVESGQRGGYYYSSQLLVTAAGAAMGAKVLTTLESPDRAGWSPMITLTELEFERHRGQTGRLEAEIDVPLTRLREVATLPVTPGVSLDRGASRLEITAVQRGPDSRGVVIRQWRARSPVSTPGAPSQYFALRRRSSGEALMGGVENGWQLNGRPNAPSMLFGTLPLIGNRNPLFFPFIDAGFSVGTSYLRFPGRGFGIVPNLDVASFDDAELVVLETVSAGVVTRHLTIDPFVVPAR